MAMLQTVAVSVVTVVVLILLYRFVFNPQTMVATSGSSTCPDRWSLDGGLCVPSYDTTCAPFDPQTITSKAYGCNLARTCGTSWPGMCP